MEGARPDQVNTAEAMAVPGVIQVLALPFGVAVLGNSVEATRAARLVLKAKVTWDTSNARAAGFDSERAKEDYARHGRSVEVEVWELGDAQFGSFVAEVPPPLCIGTVELADGTWHKGFLCEPRALVGAQDITAHGGWRAYLAASSAG